MSRYTTSAIAARAAATEPPPCRQLDPPIGGFSLLAEAEKLAREFGWTVLPVNGKRTLVRWAELQDNRESSWKARKRFKGCNAAQITGIAVICGSASRGLVCRDFDMTAGYRAWALAFPKLARELPTARTPRGFHVYFRSNREVYREHGDGELRGSAKQYVVIPPSKVPDGASYEWLIPPVPGRGGNLRFLNPTKAGLDRPWHPPDKHHKHDNQGNVTQEIINSICASPVWVSNVNSNPNTSIQSLILANLPCQHGQRHHRLFDLVRRLKAIPAFANADPLTLERIVRQWHQAALPAIRTKRFAPTWSEFLDAWKRCLSPYGSSHAGDFALAAAMASPCPIASNYANSERLALLASICWHLSGFGAGEFFISTGDTARLLGIDGDGRRMAAWRLLNRLEADGIIVCVRRGLQGATSGRATEYAWKGGQK
jgi:hypothetical protein